MQKTLFTLVAIILLPTFLTASNGVKAYFNHCNFYSPADKPYIETYLSIIGNSVIYNKNANGKYQGTVQVSIAFMQDSLIKNFKKYELLSTEEANDTISRANFIDQQRFALDNGAYTMEIEIADKAEPEKKFISTEKIIVDFPTDKISLSHIELLESATKTETQNKLSKGGYDIVPYVSTYYPENFNTLSFYAEVYNTSKIWGDKEKYLVNYFIEDANKKQKLSSYSNFTKCESSIVNSLLHSFSIDNLPSGNYNLCIEVRDKKNQLVTTNKLFFQRSNAIATYTNQDLSQIDWSKTFLGKVTDTDSLIEMIRCTRPISNQSEITYSENQIHSREDSLLRTYIFTFWQKRNPSNPEQSWQIYYNNVVEVNRLFTTSTKKGYATDRGRVYLQYGNPSERGVYEHDSNTLPYEIWKYDKLGNQTQRKFVFYYPELSTNDYKLLHSTASGEIQDSRWQIKLSNRLNPNSNLDVERVDNDYSGSHIEENFYGTRATPGTKSRDIGNK